MPNCMHMPTFFLHKMVRSIERTAKNFSDGQKHSEQSPKEDVEVGYDGNEDVD